MLSMIQGEVVTRYGWLTPQEFTDIVAISQMTPGPIGINSATYVGYSTIAEQYTENFSSSQEDMYSFIISIIIFLAAFIGTRKYKVNPILMIIVCGIAGLIFY